MVWGMHFMEGQGFTTQTVLHQDNMSTVKLEVNGKRSSGQRTRHLHIKYFTVSDHIDQGWLSVRYCPTGDMIADYFTKPLQGEAFRKFRALIMNCAEDLPPATRKTTRQRPTCRKQSNDKPQGCVGGSVNATGGRRVRWGPAPRRAPERPARARVRGRR